MATWRTIADSEIDPDSPVTSELMTALRDNLDATAEGASGAPSVLPGIAANAAAGAVGTYIMASYASTNGEGSGAAEGTTVAGSGLFYSGISLDSSEVEYVKACGTSTNTLSGTWRAMGSGVTPAVPAVTFVGSNITLWLRIV